jgi:hypothetical protein
LITSTIHVTNDDPIIRRSTQAVTMTPTLLALAMIAQPEAQVGRKHAVQIANAIIPVAIKNRIDPTLLAAIAIAESGGRNRVAFRRGRKKRGADVGVFQIHCRSSRYSCITRFLNTEQSAAEAARILTLGRRLCRNPPAAYRKMCKRGYWARYNPGSRRWSKRVKRLWKGIRSHLERHTGV